MIENDLVLNEVKGVDIQTIVLFENNLVLFQSTIEKAVNLHLEFWRELLEETPDIHKLQILGSKITSIVEFTSEMFKTLNDSNQNHVRCLDIYGSFLKDIVNDEAEGQRYLEKYKYLIFSN